MQPATIRLFGVTEGQNSVLVHVHDFISYFWIECPAEFNPSPDNLEQLKAALNVKKRIFECGLNCIGEMSNNIQH